MALLKGHSGGGGLSFCPLIGDHVIPILPLPACDKAAVARNSLFGHLQYRGRSEVRAGRRLIKIRTSIVHFKVELQPLDLAMDFSS